MMVVPDRPLCGDDLDQCDWQAIVEESPRRECFAYSDEYSRRARDASASESCAVLFEFLSKVTSLNSPPDEQDSPFGPEAVLGAIRPEDLRLLATRAETVRDPELRARVRDLSWVLNRDHLLGVAAISDYLAVADAADAAENWFQFYHRLRRALDLALRLRSEDSVNAVMARIDAFLDTYDERHRARFLAKQLIELLVDARQGESAKYAELAGRVASASNRVREWDRARAYWLLQARIDERLGDTESAYSAREQAAQTHVKEAREEAAKGAPFTGVAVHQLLQAVHAFRQLGQREHAEALHAEVLGLQERARAEAQPFSVPVDLSAQVDAARAAIRGKELFPALLTLASLAELPSVSWLREQTEEEIQAYPVQHLIQMALRDGRGRAIARRPSRGDNEDDDELALRFDMLRNAEWFRGALVAATIEPARHQITLEHQPELRNFLDLVAQSPFVPRDRETLFARGLLAGLRGDFVVATNLLVPQIEHAIRWVFELNGVITSTLDADDIQEDRMLGTLLQTPPNSQAAIEIFGEDLAFDLRGLLVERAGANLRNRIAHGLMSDADFSGTDVVYAWWLALRLCIWSTVISQAATDPARAGQTANENPDPSSE